MDFTNLLELALTEISEGLFGDGDRGKAGKGPLRGESGVLTPLLGAFLRGEIGLAASEGGGVLVGTSPVGEVRDRVRGEGKPRRLDDCEGGATLVKAPLLGGAGRESVLDDSLGFSLANEEALLA